MKRKGQITYEITEEEFKRLKTAAFDIKYFFDNGEYKEDAERGAHVIQELLDEQEIDN